MEQYYDEYWGTGDPPAWFDPGAPPARHTHRLLSRHIRGDETLLDLGCGLGSDYGVWLSGRCPGYHGVDVSPRAVELGRSFGMRNLVVGRVDALPYESESFDLVLCAEVLEHLFDPDAALREAYRVLRPGGRIIVTVPNIAHWISRAKLVLGQWEPGGVPDAQTWRDPHLRFFVPRTLGMLLAEAAFTDVQIEGYTARSLGAVLRHRRGHLAQAGPLGERLARLLPSLWASNLAGIATRP